jgi:hypothetical protein
MKPRFTTGPCLLRAHPRVASAIVSAHCVALKACAGWESSGRASHSNLQLWLCGPAASPAGCAAPQPAHPGAARMVTTRKRVSSAIAIFTADIRAFSQGLLSNVGYLKRTIEVGGAVSVGGAAAGRWWVWAGIAWHSDSPQQQPAGCEMWLDLPVPLQPPNLRTHWQAWRNRCQSWRRS